MSVEATARDAVAICVGRAVRHWSRWGSEAKAWIVTDVSFVVEDAVLPDGRIESGRTVLLPFWGGTVDGETQSLAGVAPPSDGERCLMMLRPGWDGPGSTPAVGVTMGIFPVRTAGTSGTHTVTDYDGAPLSMSEDGRIVRERETTVSARNRRPVTLAAFTRWLRERLPAIHESPRPSGGAIDPNDPHLLRPFFLTPDPQATREAPRLDASEIVPPRSFAETKIRPTEPQPPKRSVGYDVKAVAVPGPARTTASRSETVRTQYYVFGRANVPIVVNQFPGALMFSDMVSIPGPEDQYQIEKWNYYANVFQVRANPTGTYGWGNGRFDLAGFVTSEKLMAVYGMPWPGNMSSTTFRKKSRDGTIEEADIALNPAFRWSLDDEWIYTGNNALAFRCALVHELGHMLGLEHQPDYLSVMNQPQAFYRAFGFPYADDAEGVRRLYPAQAREQTDLGIYMYRSVGKENWAEPTLPTRAFIGKTIPIRDYHLENVGTESVARPLVEWYLCTARNFDQPNYYLGTTKYPALNRFDYFFPHTVVRTLTIPADVPPGEYYLGAFIRGEDGDSQGSFPFVNNLAWSRAKMQVERP